MYRSENQKKHIEETMTFPPHYKILLLSSDERLLAEVLSVLSVVSAAVVCCAAAATARGNPGNGTTNKVIHSQPTGKQ